MNSIEFLDELRRCGCERYGSDCGARFIDLIQEFISSALVVVLRTSLKKENSKRSE